MRDCTCDSLKLTDFYILGSKTDYFGPRKATDSFTGSETQVGDW